MGEIQKDRARERAGVAIYSSAPRASIVRPGSLDSVLFTPSSGSPPELAIARESISGAAYLRAAARATSLA